MQGNVPWPPTDVVKLEKALDDLAASVREPPQQRSDDEQIWLTRFLVVRSCGYLEQVMHRCTVEHLEERSYGTARSYALSWLERSINPSLGNVSTTLGRFDQNLADEFERLLSDDDNELKNELSVLVTKRHAIAHGTNEGLGSQRALALYDVAKRVADWMILRLNPDPARGSSFSRR